MTAVEWLVQKTKLTDFWKEEIQQALEIEKQQIIDAYIEGHNVYRCVTDNIDEAKECFNEWFKTYKSNNP
jgi:hypothetical protein